MMYNGFSDIYSVDYNVKNIFVMDQFWNNNQQFSMNNPRPTNALLLFVGCSAKYFDYKTRSSITIPKGSLFYIPEGATYSWTFFDCEPQTVSTILLEFVLTDEKGNIIEIGSCAEILDILRYEQLKDLFNKLVNEYSRPVISTAAVKSASHEILGILSSEGRENHSENIKLKTISKGINYLETDPEQTKSVKEIAGMCNVSINYFERLFKEYSGVTPTTYRILKKLQRAKLLLSNEALNIDQVSLKLGFEDTAYFCRIFKKYNKCTPSQYRQNIRK